jgi:pyridoxal phosphate enzyme (YggS family)
MPLSGVTERVGDVRDRIERARERSGSSHPVTLVAVTKNHPAEVAEAVIAAGVGDVGENRVPELAAKVERLGRGAARWHLIGHLQRNKVRRALPLVNLIHSLDSLSLAEAISAEMAGSGDRVRVLVQANVSGEDSKGGFDAAEALDAAARIAELPGIHPVGMMTMAPFGAPEGTLRRVFGATRRLWEDAGRQISGFDAEVLSMGMSDDFEIAVEEGSTMVRVGTLLFGERQP